MKKVIATKNQKKELKNEIARPMDDQEIRNHLGNIKIVKYGNLKKLRSIDELLPNKVDACIFLIERTKDNGHWVGCAKYPDEKNQNESVIEFFDPYGETDKDILKWNTKEQNKNVGVERPYFSDLIDRSNKKLLYNNKEYQNKGSPNMPVNCCGRHCVHRILKLFMDGLRLNDYHKFMDKMKKNTNLNYDEIVSALI